MATGGVINQLVRCSLPPSSRSFPLPYLSPTCSRPPPLHYGPITLLYLSSPSLKSCSSFKSCSKFKARRSSPVLVSQAVSETPQAKSSGFLCAQGFEQRDVSPSSRLLCKFSSSGSLWRRSSWQDSEFWSSVIAFKIPLSRSNKVMYS